MEILIALLVGQVTGLVFVTGLALITMFLTWDKDFVVDEIGTLFRLGVVLGLITTCMVLGH